jgi:hypothetical protein
MDLMVADIDWNAFKILVDIKRGVLNNLENGISSKRSKISCRKGHNVVGLYEHMCDYEHLLK